MELLLQWDYAVFNWLNQTLSHPILDAIMPYWRSKYLWIPMYAFFMVFFVINFKKFGFMAIVVLSLAVGMADYTSSTLIKKTVQRERPCRIDAVAEQIQTRVHCGGGYSFPSSHATNHFALAVGLIIALRGVWRWIAIPLLLWAASIAFGQVYVGVHFPLDVLVGVLLGSIIGAAGGQIAYQWLLRSPYYVVND